MYVQLLHYRQLVKSHMIVQMGFYMMIQYLELVGCFDMSKIPD